MRFALALFALGLIGCREPDKGNAASRAPTGPAPIAIDLDESLRTNLSKLALGRLSAQLAAPSVDAYIDQLLENMAFPEHVARSLVLGWIVHTPDEAASQLLKLQSFQAQIDGRQQTIYHLLEPCEPKQAVDVQPWWNAQTTIKVCPSAYAPDRVTDPETGFRCGSKNQVDQLRNLGAQRTADGKPLDGRGTYCGCGPQLVFCVPDEATRNQMAVALQREAIETIARVVQEDRPLEDAFIGNATYRDSKADFFYQRPRMLAGELAAVTVDNSPAGWRPRQETWPGQHAGIFTAYHLLHLTDGVRDRMRDYFSLAWCKELGSHGATAEQMLALGVTDLRG